MRETGKLVRGLTVAMLCGIGLGACRDNGLPNRNLPLAEARHKTFRYLAYQPTTTNRPVALAGSLWIGSLPIESIPDRMLEQAGNAEGTVLYALKGRRAPYSRLYSPVGGGRWRPFLRL